MTTTKTDSDIVITSGKLNGELMEAFLSEVFDIKNLLEIRSVLLIANQGDVRVGEAVSLLTREIESRTNSLSANIIQFFRIREIETKK